MAGPRGPAVLPGDDAADILQALERALRGDYAIRPTANVRPRRARTNGIAAPVEATGATARNNGRANTSSQLIALWSGRGAPGKTLPRHELPGAGRRGGTDGAGRAGRDGSEPGRVR